jgi:hypothetical protein
MLHIYIRTAGEEFSLIYISIFPVKVISQIFQKSQFLPPFRSLTIFLTENTLVRINLTKFSFGAYSLVPVPNQTITPISWCTQSFSFIRTEACFFGLWYILLPSTIYSCRTCVWKTKLQEINNIWAIIQYTHIIIRVPIHRECMATSWLITTWYLQND